MFGTTYNLKKFGNIVKRIRKELHLSQNDVKKAINISTNTIRRLEKGETIPTYDTIELLSILYKEDLLMILQKCKFTPPLYDIYNKVDLAIINQTPDMIEKIIISINKAKSLNNKIQLIDPSQYRQLLYFLDLIKESTIYNDKLNHDYILKLKDCLRISIPDFKLSTIEQYKYNFIELRILLLIGLIYKGNNNYNEAITILEKVNSTLVKKETFSPNTVKVILKIVSNLSYVYYNIENLEKSLTHANNGIRICKKYDTLYILYSFYARKGIAKLLLDRDGYLNDFYNSICLLDILEKHELKKIYKKIFKEKYDIDIKHR